MNLLSKSTSSREDLEGLFGVLLPTLINPLKLLLFLVGEEVIVVVVVVSVTVDAADVVPVALTRVCRCSFDSRHDSDLET